MKRRQFIQAAGIGLAASAIAKPIAQSLAARQLRTHDFSFAADDVLQVLHKPHGPFQFVGSASSHFQAEPLMMDTNGYPVVTSDWEMEVIKNVEGKRSK